MAGGSIGSDPLPVPKHNTQDLEPTIDWTVSISLWIKYGPKFGYDQLIIHNTLYMSWLDNTVL